MRFTFPLITILASSLFLGCQKNTAIDQDTKNKPIAESLEKPLASYPLARHFQCLPKSAALIAAHRGTSKRHKLSENSKEALLALIDHGTLVAEIDVAQSKDGIHFLYHDGVWDDDSTGQGAVAATQWRQAKTYLLNDTEGKLTSHGLSSLEDYLKLAKNKIYLEIDFKSSADYRTVIDMLRRYKMADKSILIAYSEKQAKALARLAPNMMISMSVRGKNDLNTYKKDGIKIKNIAAWTGRDGPNKNLETLLKENNIPILTYPSRDRSKQLINIADLIVSDYAMNQKPIIGRYNESNYRTCLNK